MQPMVYVLRISGILIWSRDADLKTGLDPICATLILSQGSRNGADVCSWNLSMASLTPSSRWCFYPRWLVTSSLPC